MHRIGGQLLVGADRAGKIPTVNEEVANSEAQQLLRGHVACRVLTGDVLKIGLVKRFALRCQSGVDRAQRVGANEVSGKEANRLNA